MLKKFTTENELGQGWDKVPKNKTDVKIKMVELLIALRKENENGKFVLSQNRFLITLSSMWGAANPSATLHYNDRVRAFGIIMSIETNRSIFQRLAEGCTSRRDIDDPAYLLQQMFQAIAFQFNDERVRIKMSPDAYDIDGIGMIDPNDLSRIRIT